ncbi:MAG: hypothetical protein WAU77_00695 [Solirubrobacteraceae bacterium]|jgi:hypothetical protein
MSTSGSVEPDVEDNPQGTEERRERIRLETPRHRIEGSLMLARDGYRSRVSDMLNASERDFLTLTDVTLTPLDGGPTERHAFMAIARAHIVYVVAPGADASSAKRLD